MTSSHFDTSGTEVDARTLSEGSCSNSIAGLENSLGSAGTKSALQENIERKGKHAYYFAHAHKANGPEWDGKIQPKLLSLSSVEEEQRSSGSSFEYHKSNITSYAFSDEGKTVKLYITLEGVGERCEEGDITLDITEQSFCLVVRNYDEQTRCLSFANLADRISGASFKLKKDKLVIILKKEKEGQWHTINNKGSPDHELV